MIFTTGAEAGEAIAGIGSGNRIATAARSIDAERADRAESNGSETANGEAADEKEGRSTGDFLAAPLSRPRIGAAAASSVSGDLAGAGITSDTWL
jgi:hypothetical protein